MFIALHEIRRAWVRFALVVTAIGLLVFLILFQQTLQSGLITSFVGAIEHQSSPVLVYSVDGLCNLEGSVILPDVEQDVRSVDGVGVAGRIGQGTFSVRAGGQTTSAAIVGFEDPRVGAPTTLVSGRMAAADGEAVALESSADEGFGLGDTVRVEPGVSSCASSARRRRSDCTRRPPCSRHTGRSRRSSHPPTRRPADSPPQRSG